MFTLDRDSAIPLSEQIDARLRALIGNGQLSAGARLTSIRQLATQLDISPNTVVVAYDRLVADGLVFSRGTAGYFVADAGEEEASHAAPLEAGEEQEPVWLAQQANDQRPGVLQASSGAVPLTWLEDAIPASLVQRALSKSVGGMAARCPSQGMEALRERLATLMRSQGLAVDASRVLTTAGGTHAIDLICRAFVKPGDAVIVEDPGYFLLFGRLKQTGAKVIPVSRRPDGIDLAELEAACIEHRPRLMFLQPVLHNPTGWGSSPANLHRVLRLAEQHDVLIAEDDVHGHFQSGQPARIAQLAALERVIYFSSFCKVLSPALRLGYVAADPALLKPLMREKIYSLLTTPALNELVLLELLSTGRFRKHVDRLQQRLGTARAIAATRLREVGIELHQMADAGLFLWSRLPAGANVTELVKEAYRRDIVMAQGGTFRPVAGTADDHIRFNVAASQDVRLANFLGERLKASALAGVTLARAKARSAD
jgi:DNA-binding transcriptional MocR family regulator